LQPKLASIGTPLIGGPFTLLDTEGKRVSDQDFRGKFMLVFFGYTNCPDVCPAELQIISEALEKLGPDAGKVAPIFITVDPLRDTPQILSAYVKNFGPRVTGLTGTPDDIASVAKAYRVFFRKAKASPNDPDYTVDHSAFTYLMDQQGKYLSHFTFGTTPDAMAAVLKKHIS
jgi:protein SCO1/2